MTENSKNNYLFPLIVMASMFFLLGFITTMNNSLIEFLSKAFKINGAATVINSKTIAQYIFLWCIHFIHTCRVFDSTYRVQEWSTSWFSIIDTGFISMCSSCFRLDIIVF